VRRRRCDQNPNAIQNLKWIAESRFVRTTPSRFPSTFGVTHDEWQTLAATGTDDMPHAHVKAVENVLPTGLPKPTALGCISTHSDAQSKAERSIPFEVRGDSEKSQKHRANPCIRPESEGGEGGTLLRSLVWFACFASADPTVVQNPLLIWDLNRPASTCSANQSSRTLRACVHRMCTTYAPARSRIAGLLRYRSVQGANHIQKHSHKQHVKSDGRGEAMRPNGELTPYDALAHRSAPAAADTARSISAFRLAGRGEHIR